MKRFSALFLALSLFAAALSGCGQTAGEPQSEQVHAAGARSWPEAVSIALSDDGVRVNGETAGGDPAAAAYVANDIVYYESDRNFTYGEGTEADAHSASEADGHTVVHITRPGAYILSGTLSQGQIAVDLGEDAEDDPGAVVTLILNGVEISCSVAPAVIFYSVYECGDKENPSMDVDTSAAGANVVIADGTFNGISGSYVARIYEPGSVELSGDGGSVADAQHVQRRGGEYRITIKKEARPGLFLCDVSTQTRTKYFS